MKKSFISLIAALIFSMGFAGHIYAQKDQLEKVWYNGDRSSKIEIYLKDGSYYGKITWLKDPNDEKTGKPALDKENPDEKLRSASIQGLVIMKGFKKTPDNKDVYRDGTIYDPKNGKTYCGKITFKGKTLDLRGFFCSFSWLGRTETWELVEGQ